MPEYRRARIEGGTYFFTLVTYRRCPILTQPETRRLLHDAWVDVRARFPFRTLAVGLLPEHLHCIWELPEGDSDFSLRWKEIKRLFTRGYLASLGPGQERNASRLKQGEAAIWQRRFWEHVIRDEADFLRHLDYVHFNPVKHGLVRRVAAWPWSSFHRYVRQEWYDAGWGDEGGAGDAGMGVRWAYSGGFKSEPTLRTVLTSYFSYKAHIMYLSLMITVYGR